MQHFISESEVTFVLIMVPMWVTMIRHRAPVLEYFRSLIMAPVLMLAVGIVMLLAGAALGAIGLHFTPLLWLIGAAAAVYLGHRGGLGMVYALHDSVARHWRGAVVSGGAAARGRGGAAQRRRFADVAKGVITLAGIPIAPADEAKHFKIIGTTGTGKSTAIREMLGAALARGDRAVIADPDGGYLRDFHAPERGDVILNPFDPDSLKWHLMGEIDRDYDVDQLARSLIPDASSERPWGDYARTLFAAVIQQARAGQIQDDAEIYRLLTSATAAELRVLLAGTPAEPFLEQANDRMFGSVRSVTSSAVRALKYTAQQRAPAFSVRQWVRQGAARDAGGRGGVLFIPYKAGEIAALRSIISAWMRIAIFEAMDGGDGDHHLWFVVDELDALGEIDGLKDALARLRKFGGRCILGLQSISQVSSTYGKGAADTIVENCGNTLILRCSASEHGGTSQFASRLIGQREVVHTSRSKTHHPGNWFASTTENEQRTVEAAVMASEVERLADLQGFLKLASIPDWQRVALTYVSYPPRRRPGRKAAVPTADGPSATEESGDSTVRRPRKKGQSTP